MSSLAVQNSSAAKDPVHEHDLRQARHLIWMPPRLCLGHVLEIPKYPSATTPIFCHARSMLPAPQPDDSCAFDSTLSTPNDEAAVDLFGLTISDLPLDSQLEVLHRGKHSVQSTTSLRGVFSLLPRLTERDGSHPIALAFAGAVVSSHHQHLRLRVCHSNEVSVLVLCRLPNSPIRVILSNILVVTISPCASSYA